jgi:putative colanic acid biosynthesis acetyltransferase WcaF
MSRLVKLPGITKMDRFRRLTWGVVRLLLYRPTPVAMHGWRAHILRAFGAKIEGRVYLYPDIVVWAPWNLYMAPESCLGPGSICYNVAPVRLGYGVTVSQRSHLCTASHDFDDPEFPLTGAPITLEDGTWIATEAFVGPGVTVGTRAVILARAMVVRDVKPGAVMAGNPAKLLRYRTPEEGNFNP